MTVLVFALTVLFSTLSLFPDYPELAVGVTYDLAFTAPIFYYLSIRNTRIPKFTVLGVGGLGLLLATLLLPPGQKSHLNFIVYYLAPAAELLVLGLVGFKTWKLIRVFREKRKESADVRTLFDEVTEGLLGESFLARAAAFELTILYYALIRWRKPAETANSFTYHKKRGAGAIFGVFVFLVAAETVVFHLLIAQWSTIAAWVLSLSSLYVLFLLTAQYKATYLRPIEVSDGVLKIRCGLFCDAEIPLCEIESVDDNLLNRTLAKEVQQAAFLKGFEPLNVLISTTTVQTATGPYGVRNSFRELALFVDDKVQFVDILKNYDA